MVRKNLLTALIWCWPLLTFCQVLEFSAPTKLPGTINTPAEEGMPLLSPDGKTLFFTRALYKGNIGGEYAGHDVWTSDNSNTGWKKANNSIVSINNRNNNVVVGIGQDGKTLYFIDVSTSQKMQGIYVSKQVNDHWGRPELIPIPGIDNIDFIGIYVSPDFEVIFLSMKSTDSKGNEDLYYSVKDLSGMWIKPRNLGATINTQGYEISPFISADKKRLYFSSDGHGGEGDADIFYSERLYNSWETWSLPVNLGSVINSKKFDAYFSVYGDSVAYFASNRNGNYADLYTSYVYPAKTILSKGQRYLTIEEWNSLIGRNVNHKISFERGSSKLNEPQQELIFYIVNKLMLEKDIRFHLVVREEEDSALSKSRLQAVIDQLKQSGIDAVRIYEEQVAATKKSDNGIIEIQLFK